MKTFALAALLVASLAAATPGWAQKVKLNTTMGDIVIELDAAKAPKSVANFLQYVKAGHYNGTIFHRVIDGYMIQAGGLTADMREKAKRPPIPLEAGNGLSNLRGTVAMARTMVPDSATAEFFINVVDNVPLDTYSGGYAVFGKVVDGMAVVDRIKAVPVTNKGARQDVPQQPITIQQATILSEK